MQAYFLVVANKNANAYIISPQKQKSNII
jgi:hypothetical protein